MKVQRNNNEYGNRKNELGSVDHRSKSVAHRQMWTLYVPRRSFNDGVVEF